LRKAPIFHCKNPPFYGQTPARQWSLITAHFHRSLNNHERFTQLA
jgi:hypothetical protein